MRERSAARELDAVPAGKLEALLAAPTRQIALAMAAAAVVATLSATQLYVNWRASGLEVDFGRLLFAEGVEWGLWALFLPFIVALDRRLERGHRRRAFAFHLGVGVLWFAVLNLALSGLTLLTDPAAAVSLGAVYRDRALMRLPSTLAVYFFIVAGVWLIKSLIRQERLRRGLLEAQLRSLRAQIQPHFLFNTLHTASSLVRSEDRAAAVRTIVGLSDLLRRSLRHEGEDEVPLSEELDFLETYLDIQRTRFGDRLHARIELGEGVESALVPFLMLQPLVENAIRHGLDLDAEPGHVVVRVHRAGARLEIGVTDSGGGPSQNGGLGLGLDNVRGRLEALYGAAHDLRFSTAPGEGTRVDIDIPYRLEDDD
jgi:two-component sensor histidine kinase